MLGIQSCKEPDASSLDSKIACRTVTSSTSDDSARAGRYANVQGSKWFREKSGFAGSDIFKGGTLSVQGTPMKPVALVTSVQSDVINSSAQELGERKDVVTTDLAPLSDDVNVSIVMPPDEDEARRSVLPRLVATTSAATFPCDTSTGTQPQRGGGPSTASPAAHTSTRVKTLTPFCLRSRRGEDRQLSVSPNPLSMGLTTTEDSSSEVAFTGSSPHLHTCSVDDSKTTAPDGHIKQLSSPIIDFASAPLTITTQNSTDLNTQVSELTKDLTPSSLVCTAQRTEVPSLASSMPTLTVQATSTRTTSAVQQTSLTGGSTGDPVGGLRSVNQTAKDGHLKSSTDAIPERLSPRPRANIFADIRERVFGAKSPGTSTTGHQFGSSVLQSQPLVPHQQQQLQPHIHAISQSKESADKSQVGGTTASSTCAAPLAVAEDDMIDADEMEPTQLEESDEGQQSIYSDANTCKTVTTTAVTQPIAPSLVAAAETSLGGSSENAASTDDTLVADRPSDISVSVADADKIELQTVVRRLSNTIGQVSSRDQTAQPPSKVDEYAMSLDKQFQKQQRTVARAEVPPWRTMDLPGTQYGVQQFQKSPANCGNVISAVKPVTAFAQERIEMSLPSPTAQIGGFIVMSTTSSQEPLTVKMPKTESLTPKAIETVSAQAEEVSPSWRTASTGTSGRIVPSSVSRVDWAKQRFGATQSLDSSGFSVAPEIQPRRGSGETSPKLPVRSMAMMSSVPEIPVPPTTIEEMPCSPRTYRRLIVSTPGNRFVAPAPLAESSDGGQNSNATVSVPSTLSVAPTAHVVSSAVPVPSKIAVVHGHQVLPSVAMTSSTEGAPTTAFDIRSAVIESLPTPVIDTSLTRDQAVLPPSTMRSTLESSQSVVSSSIPVNSTPTVTPGGKTQTQLTQNFQQKSSMMSGTTGSGFSLRMPEPVVRFQPPAMSAAAATAASSDSTKTIESDKSVTLHTTSSTSAMLKPQPASTISEQLNNERSLNQSSGHSGYLRQAPHPSVHLKSTVAALSSDQSQRIPRQPQDSVIASVTSSGSASSQQQFQSATPQSTREQVFQFPTSSVEPAPLLIDSSCASISMPSSSIRQQDPQSEVLSSRSSVSRDNNEVSSLRSQSIQTTQVVSAPTLRDIEIRAPTIDQVVARPALPTVRALISKPTVPEVHLIAIPLRPAVVVESVVPESELFPVTMSALPPPTSKSSIETPSVRIGNQGNGNQGNNNTPSVSVDAEHAPNHRSTDAQKDHVINKPLPLIGRATAVSNSTVEANPPFQTIIQEKLQGSKMASSDSSMSSAVNLSSVTFNTETISRPIMSSMTSPSIVSTSSGGRMPVSHASTQPLSMETNAGFQINVEATSTLGQISTVSQSVTVPKEPATKPVAISTSSIATSNGSRQMAPASSSAPVVASIQPTSRSLATESTRQSIQQQWQSQQQQQPHQQHQQLQQQELQPQKNRQQGQHQQEEPHRSVTSSNQQRAVQFSTTSASNTTIKMNENDGFIQEKQQPQPQQDRASILKKSASESVATSRPALSRQKTLPATLNASIETSPRQPKSTGSSELNEALAELDNIAAETRQLSKSLNVSTDSPHHLQVSPASSTSRPHGGSRSPEPSSLISAVTAALDARIQGKTVVHPKLAALHETRSLDRSGIARRQLEQLINPVTTSTAAGTAAIHKSVALRKPRPLRKAQTVSLTGLGLGVDPDLMSLLASRKEKSASDDEDQKTPNSSRSDSKDQDEEETEKMPSVSERIKKMETKKIRFAVLREKAAQRRMAQSMTSLTSPDMGYTDQSTLSTGESRASPLASSQSKLDRLACFAAISDTSVGMKRVELQRRQLTTGRRLSQPVTLKELDKTETLQSVTSFNEQVRTRITSSSTRNVRRWMWHRQPTPRDRLTAASKRNQRRRSLPSSSSTSGNVGDRLSARQRAIMLRSSRYNVALPARVHSMPRVAVEDTSPQSGGVTIIGHGPLTHTERVQPMTSGVWNSPSLPSSTSSSSSSAYQNTMSRGPSAADQISQAYHQTRDEHQRSEASSFNAPSFVSSKQLVTSSSPHQEMTSRSQVQFASQQHQIQQPQQQYQYQQLVGTVNRPTEQRHHHDFQTAATPMAAAARLVQMTPPLDEGQKVTMTRPPIDKSRTDEPHQGAPVVHQRKQHTVQPIRRTIQRMDSLDDDEFDKMVEVNIRQLQVEGGDSGSTGTAANASKQNTPGIALLGAPTVSAHQSLSPRLARRSPQQQQPQQPQQYGVTSGHTGGDTMQTTTVARRLQGAETETVRTSTSRSMVTSSSKQPVTSWPGSSKKPQQQREEQEKKDEESEDELSKLSIADKLKLFSGKKSLSSQQREAASVVMATKGDGTAKSKRQMNRHQTQISESEPVTWEELEQAAQFEASSRAKHGHGHGHGYGHDHGGYGYGQPVMSSGQMNLVAGTAHLRAQPPKQFTAQDVSRNVLFYRDF